MLALPVLAVALVAACSSPGEDPASASASVNAALSSAAQASPGAYGQPADPSMPNPTVVATDPPVATTPSGAATADVVVTYASWVTDSNSVEVGAYVAAVVESGGTCTLELTGPTAPASVRVTAEPDAGSTSCPDMVIAGGDLRTGTYSAVVAYTPAGAVQPSGTSAPTAVDVP